MRSVRRRRTLEENSRPRWHGRSRTGRRIRSAIESGILAGLLLAVVFSAVAGVPVVLAGAVVGAWLVLAVIVGPRNVLDAGCAFMLLAVGVILVVDLAINGPSSVLP